MQARRKKHLAAIAMLLSLIAWQRSAQAQIDPLPPGSPTFCLFALPSEANKRAWLNLGLVQYIELHPSELRIYYGGGHFGSGHELRIPMTSKDEASAFMKKMLTSAASCRCGALR